MRTTVLLPPDLHERLKEIAFYDARSLHREIIYALARFAEGRTDAPTRSGHPATESEG